MFRVAAVQCATLPWPKLYDKSQAHKVVWLDFLLLRNHLNCSKHQIVKQVRSTKKSQLPSTHVFHQQVSSRIISCYTMLRCDSKGRFLHIWQKNIFVIWTLLARSCWQQYSCLRPDVAVRRRTENMISRDGPTGHGLVKSVVQRRSPMAESERDRTAFSGVPCSNPGGGRPIFSVGKWRFIYPCIYLGARCTTCTSILAPG
jgi:hypothetical protein